MSLQSFGEFFILFPGYNGRMVSSWRHHADMLSDFVSTCSLPLSLPICISLCTVSPPFCLTGVCIPLASISYLSEDSFPPPIVVSFIVSWPKFVQTNTHAYTHTCIYQIHDINACLWVNSNLTEELRMESLNIQKQEEKDILYSIISIFIRSHNYQK